MAFALTVNGTTHRLALDGDTPLLWALRDGLGLTGTKYGCGIAQCGVCTVLVEGAPMRSCVLPLQAWARAPSPPSRASRARRQRPCARPGSRTTFPNAAIASRARS